MDITIKKKILFLITKSNWGGAQRYVFDLASHLNPEEYDVVVALGGDGELSTELASAHIRVLPLTHLTRDISIRSEWNAIKELYRIIKEEHPDILHINSSKAGGLGTLLGRIVGVPNIIFTAHGWAFNEDRPLYQKFLIGILHWITVLLAHTTIAVSNTTKKQLRGPFVQNKMRVIHNGRSIPYLLQREDARTFLSAHTPELSAYKSDFWSVTIGELHSVKQHQVMLYALKAVVQNNPNIRHVIIGEGEMRAHLEDLITRSDLGKHVFLIGAVPEASEYLRAFDLFVLPSRSEALAYVIIEACIAGLPIIASNVGGIPEIITHEESGLLFPQGNISALTAYYRRLYDDVDLRSKIAACALARSKEFSFEKMFEDTIKTYENDDVYR